MQIDDRKKFELWKEEHRLVTKLFDECVAHEREFLKSLRCPTDPVAIHEILQGRHPALWPTKTAARDKHRAQRAMHAIVLLAQARRHLGPDDENARMAAHDALLAGLFLNDAISMAVGRSRRRLAGIQRGRSIAETAAAHDPAIKRLYRRFWQSDDLQDEYLSVVRYISRTMRLSAKKVARRLKHLKLSTNLGQ